VNLGDAEPGLLAWLAAGFHGEMHYMERHGLRRARPAELVPGTVSVLTVRMDYLPRQTPDDWVEREQARLREPGQAVVSVYARGRDYHKVLRQRLQRLTDRIAQAVNPMDARVFCDSAPVLEAELASRSGLGWRGKHTLLIHRDAGSAFFLGEIYLSLALPETEATNAHCGQCSACLPACPTGAIVAPHRLDARRCISYLTIEHAGPIDESLRPLMGNRIYGCDDCQLACPWNKYAQRSTLPDFDARAPIAQAHLLDVWRWSEADFERHTEGSAIRRIGHERWLRNVAIALGNAVRSAPDSATQAVFLQALAERADHPSALVQEHRRWAMAQADRALTTEPTPPRPKAG
jgi:epoxyqueuosine reductase